MRSLVFISHANPEDNEFSAWLSCQLKIHGYDTWLDLERLKGGERFWAVIQKVIEEQASKFLFVVSRSSNTKDGALNELHLALNVGRRFHLKDFVIPLHLDDLPHGEMNIQIQRLNAVPFFEKGWAYGLKAVLTKLTLDGVPHSSGGNVETIARWWESFTRPTPTQALTEVYTSNWFPATLPTVLYFHQVDTLNTDAGLTPKMVEYHHTGVLVGDQIVSFSPANELADTFGDSLSIKESSCKSPIDFLEHGSKLLPAKQARPILVQLLQQAWDGCSKVTVMNKYELANRSVVTYFTEGDVGLARVSSTVSGRHRSRQLVGTWRSSSAAGKKATHFWHFGISAKARVYPFLGYVVTPHVLFSDDGRVVWDNKDRTHRARRSQCRDWWNPAWRDRILLSVAWLAGYSDVLRIPVSKESAICVSTNPIEFSSPVSFVDPEGAPVVDYEEGGFEDETLPE
ncbi:MAG: toll/interleukin-1 receptor domain-containing protein [Bacillota bacterium]